MEVEISKRVCRPMSDCFSINTTHAPSASGAIEELPVPLFSSEVPHDFYFLSELRRYGILFYENSENRTSSRIR